MTGKPLRLHMFIIMPLLILSCGINHDTEQEPNDSFAEANEIIIGRPVRGTIHSIQDVDFFYVRIDRVSILSAKLSGLRGINLSMRFWRGGNPPELLKHIDDARKSSPEFLTNIYVEPGIYYIEVGQGARDPKSSNTENHYTLTVNTRDYFSEEKEPNDTPEQATYILPGQKMRGYFSPAYNPMNSDDAENPYREYDWFKFEVVLREGQPLSAEINLSGVPMIDSSLSLFDPDINLLKRSQHRQTGKPERLSNVGLPRSGTYYIRCEALGYRANYDTPYTLSLSVNVHNPLFELEPNDTIKQANSIREGMIYGSFGHQHDIDFFHYEPVDGDGFYRVKLSSSPGIAPGISIFDRNGNKTGEISGSVPGEDLIHPNIYIADDVYFRLDTGMFIPEESSEYVLYVDRVDLDDLIDMEPNDSRAEAVPLKGRTSIKGFTSYRGDVDYYFIEYDRRKHLEFMVISGENSSISVSITDPMGYTLKQYESIKGETVIFTEMIDRRGYIIVESVIEDYDNPYHILFKDK